MVEILACLLKVYVAAVPLQGGAPTPAYSRAAPAAGQTPVSADPIRSYALRGFKWLNDLPLPGIVPGAPGS